eukprot:TRINITY_DN2394_c0_g1_i4.p1 TRINITY_DN2394_c0_g1~~TRINITY_DN2394_c0_g1_i4.p1  ORF type:complete len:325 (-),score=132.63 TRINITY_DN2394_c0_g1_i4:391-1365(-)
MSCSFGTAAPLRSVEEYFGSMSSTSKRLMEDVSGVKSAYDSVWSELEEKERESILTESIIPPEVSLHYGDSSTEEDSSAIAGGGLDERKGVGKEYGKVYPRYKLKSGQKTLRVEMEGDNGESTSYSYLDEHSAPFHWKTRSTQELRFESGRPLSIASTELTENGLEKITSPPSKILSQRGSSRSHHQIHSRGNPSFAKPVGIPIVPGASSPSSSRISSSSSPDSIKSSQPLLKNSSESLASNRIVKPRCAPPPPPPHKRPLSAPPKDDEGTRRIIPEAHGDNRNDDDDDLSATPLEDNFKNFSINLSTDSIEIPKTGFDFLDNW